MKKNNQRVKYNMYQSCKFMFTAAWEHNKAVIWLCIILAILGSAIQVLGLYITPQVLLAVETAVPIEQLIYTILLFAGGLMTANAAESYLSTNTMFGRMVVRISLVSRINDKISTTSYPNTENQDVRKKLDKAQMSVTHNRTATEAVWETLTLLIKNVICFTIYIVLLSTLQLWIVVVVLITTVSGFFINKKINEWGYIHQDEEADYSRRMNYIMEKAADYTLAKDVRLFGMQSWMTEIFNHSLKLYENLTRRVQMKYIQADMVNIAFTFMRNGIAYIYLIHLVLNGSISASQFILFFTAVGSLANWVNGILSNIYELHKQSLDISAVQEFLAYPEPFCLEGGKPLEPMKALSYQIDLRNVSFRYPGSSIDVLNKINLSIKPGEKLAIVGLNGAGKTTLVKLICGLYDPTFGEVLLNGENIKKFNRLDYYRHFSTVFQDFSIIPTTVLENITQADSSIDLERVRDCVEKAGLTAKIASFLKGYETHLNKEIYEDGIELSGGEVQRLMLARALYNEAPIIVLDEPTAALDPIAESDMYTKYNELTARRTSLYISHRLASTLFCDRIILMDNGSIAEEGTHEELIRQGGKYFELYEIQSHYYRDNNIAGGGSDSEKEE